MRKKTILNSSHLPTLLNSNTLFVDGEEYAYDQTLEFFDSAKLDFSIIDEIPTYILNTSATDSPLWNYTLNIDEVSLVDVSNSATFFRLLDRNFIVDPNIASESSTMRLYNYDRIQTVRLNETSQFLIKGVEYNVSIVGATLDPYRVTLNVNGVSQSVSEGEFFELDSLQILTDQIFITSEPELSATAIFFFGINVIDIRVDEMLQAHPIIINGDTISGLQGVVNSVEEFTYLNIEYTPSLLNGSINDFTQTDYVLPESSITDPLFGTFEIQYGAVGDTSNVIADISGNRFGIRYHLDNFLMSNTVDLFFKDSENNIILSFDDNQRGFGIFENGTQIPRDAIFLVSDDSQNTSIFYEVDTVFVDQIDLDSVILRNYMSNELYALREGDTIPGSNYLIGTINTDSNYIILTQNTSDILYLPNSGGFVLINQTSPALHIFESYSDLQPIFDLELKVEDSLLIIEVDSSNDFLTEETGSQIKYTSNSGSTGTFNTFTRRSFSTSIKDTSFSSNRPHIVFITPRVIEPIKDLQVESCAIYLDDEYNLIYQIDEVIIGNTNTFFVDLDDKLVNVDWNIGCQFSYHSYDLMSIWYNDEFQKMFDSTMIDLFENNFTILYNNSEISEDDEFFTTVITDLREQFADRPINTINYNQITTELLQDNLVLVIEDDAVLLLIDEKHNVGTKLNQMGQFMQDRIRNHLVVPQYGSLSPMLSHNYNSETILAGLESKFYNRYEPHNLQLGEPIIIQHPHKNYTVEIIGGNSNDNSAVLSVNGVKKSIHSSSSSTYDFDGLHIRVRDIDIQNVPSASVSALLNINVPIKVESESTPSPSQPGSGSGGSSTLLQNEQLFVLGEPKNVTLANSAYNIELTGVDLESESLVLRINGVLRTFNLNATAFSNGLYFYVVDMFETNVPTYSASAQVIITNRQPRPDLVYTIHTNGSKSGVWFNDSIIIDVSKTTAVGGISYIEWSTNSGSTWNSFDESKNQTFDESADIHLRAVSNLDFHSWVVQVPYRVDTTTPTITTVEYATPFLIPNQTTTLIIDAYDLQSGLSHGYFELNGSIYNLTRTNNGFEGDFIVPQMFQFELDGGQSGQNITIYYGIFDINITLFDQVGNKLEYTKSSGYNWTAEPFISLSHINGSVVGYNEEITIYIHPVTDVEIGGDISLNISNTEFENFQHTFIPTESVNFWVYASYDGLISVNRTFNFIVDNQTPTVDYNYSVQSGFLQVNVSATDDSGISRSLLYVNNRLVRTISSFGNNFTEGVQFRVPVSSLRTDQNSFRLVVLDNAQNAFEESQNFSLNRSTRYEIQPDGGVIHRNALSNTSVYSVLYDIDGLNQTVNITTGLETRSLPDDSLFKEVVGLISINASTQGVSRVRVLVPWNDIQNMSDPYNLTFFADHGSGIENESLNSGYLQNIIIDDVEFALFWFETDSYSDFFWGEAAEVSEDSQPPSDNSNNNQQSGSSSSSGSSIIAPQTPANQTQEEQSPQIEEDQPQNTTVEAEQVGEETIDELWIDQESSKPFFVWWIVSVGGLFLAISTILVIKRRT